MDQHEQEELLPAQPDVAGAAVVGRPDPMVGELPVAYMVAPGIVDGTALMDAVNGLVLPYKRLREVVLLGAIPVYAAGKVLKRELLY